MTTSITSKMTEITYTNGTTDIVAVTMFDRVAAEKYVIAHGGRAGNDSPVFQNAYATYYALRRDRKITGTDFNEWMAGVLAFDTPQDESDAEEEEDEDSLGKSSVSTNGPMEASDASPASSAPISA